MFEHLLLQFGAKRVKANQTDEPGKRLRVFETEPANCINKKVTTEGLRVNVEVQPPAKHKTGHNVTSVPAFPYLLKQGHRIQAI
jgi:hypothetical protein